MFSKLRELRTRISSEQTLRRLFTGGGWAFSGKFLSAFIALGTNALLARMLMTEEFGAYFLVFTFVNIAGMVALLGMNDAVVKIVAESIGDNKEGRAKRAIGISFIYCCACSAVISLLVSFGLGEWLAERVFNSQELKSVVRLSAIWIFLFSIQLLVSEVYRGFHDIRSAVLFRGILSNSLTIAVFLFFLLSNRTLDLHEVVSINICSLILSNSIGILALLKRTGRITDKTSIGYGDMFSLGIPLWITNISMLLLIRTDILILGAFASQDEVAIYGALAKIVFLVAVPLVIANTFIPPIIADLYAKKDTARLERVLRSESTILIFVTVLVSLPLFLAGEELLELIYGSFFGQGATALSILCIGRIVSALTGSCGQCMIMTGHGKEMMYITVSTGILTILAASMMAKYFGFVGVAIAYASGSCTQNITQLLFVKRKLGIWTIPSFRIQLS
ncbi:flippase [Myxococcota bacterium]